MKLSIKKMSIDDIDLLLELRKETLEHVFLQEIDDSLMNENRLYYQKHLKDHSHIAFVGFLGDKAVCTGGLCLYEEMPSPDNKNGKCAYLMNIYCREEYCHNGYGTKICRRLIEEAKKQGVNKIYLQASDMAKKMYYHLQFEDITDYLQLKEDYQ